MSERVSTTTRLAELRDFLNGSGELDGVWFGEKHPTHTSPFWWRVQMREIIDAAIAAHDAAQPCGEVGELTFDAFRQANVTRCAKWHPAGIASWSPSDWLTAVTGELGELASLLKMRNRERDGLPGNKFSPTDKQVADEIADVLTYLDLLAATLGVDLGRAAVAKFNEVSERVGFPDRINLTPPPTSQPAKQGEGESAEWCAEAKLTLGRLYRFLDAIKAPYAVDTREWIENAEKMLATHPAQATIKDGEGDVVHRSAYDMAITGRREFRQMYRDERAKVAALTAEIARLREDAERYRMARRAADYANEPQCFGSDFWMPSSAAIDTAIRASRGEGL